MSGERATNSVEQLRQIVNHQQSPLEVRFNEEGQFTRSKQGKKRIFYPKEIEDTELLPRLAQENEVRVWVKDVIKDLMNPKEEETFFKRHEEKDDRFLTRLDEGTRRYFNQILNLIQSLNKPKTFQVYIHHERSNSHFVQWCIKDYNIRFWISASLEKLVWNQILSFVMDCSRVDFEDLADPIIRPGYMKITYELETRSFKKDMEATKSFIKRVLQGVNTGWNPNGDGTIGFGF